MDSHSRTCSLAVAQLRHVHSTSSAGRGSCQQPNIDRDGMPARNHEAHYVRSEVSRVHRGPRTERREFASLEPLKDEEQNSLSCGRGDLLEPYTGRRAPEVTVEWNRGGLEGRCSCPLSDGSCWKIKGSKRTARRLLFSRSAVELLPEGHGASLELVSLAPLTTARVLQALQHPSKTPWRAPPSARRTRRPCSQPRSEAPRPWPCVSGRRRGCVSRGGIFSWRVKVGTRGRSGVLFLGSAEEYLRRAGPGSIPKPPSSSACISSSSNSSAVGKGEGRSRVGAQERVRSASVPARYARSGRRGRREARALAPEARAGVVASREGIDRRARGCDVSRRLATVHSPSSRPER